MATANSIFRFQTVSNDTTELVASQYHPLVPSCPEVVALAMRGERYCEHPLTRITVVPCKADTKQPTPPAIHLQPDTASAPMQLQDWLASRFAPHTARIATYPVQPNYEHAVMHARAFFPLPPPPSSAAPQRDSEATAERRYKKHILLFTVFVSGQDATVLHTADMDKLALVPDPSAQETEYLFLQASPLYWEAECRHSAQLTAAGEVTAALHLVPVHVAHDTVTMSAPVNHFRDFVQPRPVFAEMKILATADRVVLITGAADAEESTMFDAEEQEEEAGGACWFTINRRFTDMSQWVILCAGSVQRVTVRPRAFQRDTATLDVRTCSEEQRIALPLPPAPEMLRWVSFRSLISLALRSTVQRLERLAMFMQIESIVEAQAITMQQREVRSPATDEDRLVETALQTMRTLLLEAGQPGMRTAFAACVEMIQAWESACVGCCTAADAQIPGFALELRQLRQYLKRVSNVGAPPGFTIPTKPPTLQRAAALPRAVSKLV